ncbi:MAG: hypothetical protein ACTSXP_02315 [Promethearchaeota archaeon]
MKVHWNIRPRKTTSLALMQVINELGSEATNILLRFPSLVVNSFLEEH